MARRRTSPQVFITLGIVFMVLSFALQNGRAVWLPVGVVFLVIGLAARRNANTKTPTL